MTDDKYNPNDEGNHLVSTMFETSAFPGDNKGRTQPSGITLNDS